MSRSWTREPERGSRVLARFMIWLTLRVGWRAGHLLLYPIALYFLLAATRARAASSGFLRVALRRPPTPRDLFRHFHTFAQTILDRTLLLSGRLDRFEVEVTGLEALRRQIEAKRGCILLGSHLGSFEILRAIADRFCPVPVRIVMYEANAERLNATLRTLNPEAQASIIPIGATGAMLRVKEALDAGELVGILGDRTAAGDRVLPVSFFGRPAELPAGPLVVASVLKAPVVLFYGIHLGPRRYRVSFEPFAEEVATTRRSRGADLLAWAQRYATALERSARLHPYNWFNFYDFWAEPAQRPPAPSPYRRRVPV